MTQRLPYDQWLLTQTREQLIERDLKKKQRAATKAAKTKAGYVYGKGPYYQKPRAKPRNVRGRGPYAFYGNLNGSIPFLGGGEIGGAYYSEGFQAPAAIPRVTSSSGKVTKTVKGKGPYNVISNSLIDSIDLGMDPPMVRNTNRGEATVVNHREFLGDLSSGFNPGSGSNFKLQSFALNPGNPQLFPFLAPIAFQFQEYEVRGMLVELKTLSSNISTSLSLGSMFMAADYNVLTPAPANKIQLENMEYASSAKPSCSIIMPIECEKSNDVITHLLVADNSNYEGTDARMYDLCNIYIGSQGMPVNSSIIAEIWVTYEIALFKPIIQNTATLFQAIGAHFTGSGIRDDLNLGLPVAADGTDSRFVCTGTSLTFPNTPDKQRYYVTFWWKTSETVGGTPETPVIAETVAGTTIRVLWNGGVLFDTDSVAEIIPNAAGQKMMQASVIIEVDPGVAGQISVTSGVFQDASWLVDVWVSNGPILINT